MEGRTLLSHGGVIGALGPKGFLRNPPGVEAVRPNTPVLPFAAAATAATFIDTTVHIFHGEHTVIGQKSYVAPYATLDSTTGYVKIGSGSDVLDNATIVSNPRKVRLYPPSVLIGDMTSIQYGATVLGPSVVGGYGSFASPTGIGANALIDGATVQPGAIVGTLARVGPGVTIPTGLFVLPGSNVTNNAEASNPALGKVVKIPATTQAALATILSRSSSLAQGYTTLYQGNPATGANPGVEPSVTGVNNGNLAAVEGASQEPGPATSSQATGITFEPSRTGPKFIAAHIPQAEGDFPQFRARIVGDARFGSRPRLVAHHLGHGNSFGADQGQPITFGSYPVTGRGVTINAPGGGTVTPTTIGGPPSNPTGAPTNLGVGTGGSTGGSLLDVGGVGLLPRGSSSGSSSGSGSGASSGSSSTSSTSSTTVTNGTVTIGQNFQADSGAVLLGGPAFATVVGDNVHLGGGAVVSQSVLGNGVTIGARAYVAGTTVPAGTTIPAGAIFINGQYRGQVQW